MAKNNKHAKNITPRPFRNIPEPILVHTWYDLILFGGAAGIALAVILHAAGCEP